MVPVIDVIIAVVDIYWWIVIVAAVFSWLMAFGIIDTRNHVVRTAAGFLYRATEPALRPIQRVLPSFGGLDISPVIVLLILYFIWRELLQIRLYLFMHS
ncbi:MAG: YggT family protein [Alphaproteobacteria bacterium]|nr:YggT family protein [Alphaproteobacteria bacterium]